MAVSSFSAYVELPLSRYFWVRTVGHGHPTVHPKGCVRLAAATPMGAGAAGERTRKISMDSERLPAREDCSMTPRMKTRSMVISSVRPLKLDSARSTRSAWRNLRAAGAKSSV